MSQAPSRPAPHEKRHQVAKACDSCRAHRIKCDNSRPCHNCRAKHRLCSQDWTPQAPTLSQAQKEIDSLRQKVRRLEQELQQSQNGQSGQSGQNVQNSALSTPSYVELETVDYHGQAKKQSWDGTHLRPPRAPNASWFGPSSLYFFVNRFSIALSAALHQVEPTADDMLPRPTGSEDLLSRPLSGQCPKQPRPDAGAESYLTPTQEQYFINFFWESYHTSVFPIIDEADFKEHHHSLWATDGSGERNPSALVDIVLALCMQLGVSALPTAKQGSITQNRDAAIAGRWHYRRCQMLLMHEIDSPTLATLQCHLLCAIYQCGGSFHNMIYSSVGLAVSTAYTLGLHLDPSTIPDKERQRRRILWWAVYLLDSKIGMKLGRPFQLRDSHVMPELPSDTFEATRLSGSTFGPIGCSSTWLTFNLHHTKLYQAVRQAHVLFYETDVGLQPGQTMWDTPQALDAYAELLRASLKDLDEWVEAVPAELKTRRRDGGRSFSSDGSALEIEQFSPVWLQRQRLLLEAAYHHQAVNLCRPFVSFTATPAPGSPAEEMAARCAAHAIAFTKMAHEVLTTASVFDGWHEMFQWQWSAAMTLAGYLLVASPSSASAAAARDATALAISSMEVFGASFAIALDAANIIRGVLPKINAVANRTTEQPWTMLGSDHVMMPVVEGGFDQNDMVDMVNMALDIDFWANVDQLLDSYLPLEQIDASMTVIATL